MKSKFTLFVSSFLVLALSLSLFACSSGKTPPTTSGAPSGEPIKIGALFNVTGGQASLDEPANRAFKLAADQINAAGGINGRPIEVVAYDGKTDQTTCANNAKKMIDVDKVVAIAGLSDSNYAMAAGAVAQSKGTPIVFSGATTPTIPTLVGDCAFLTAFGDNTCAYASAEYMYNELGLKKCYLLTDQSMEFTKTLSEFFVERFEALGGEIVLSDNYMNQDPDFSAQIERYLADNKGAEFMFFSGVPDDAGVLIKQFRDKGVKEPIISGDGFDTPLLWEVGGAASEGVYVSTHCSFENQDPTVQAFVKDYTAAFGIAPENAFAALGYDAMLVLKAAIEASGNDVTAENIRLNLEKIDGLRCVTGVISYKNGHVPDKSVTVNVVKDGAFSFVTEVN